jgi:hypothetical protein
VKTQKKRSIIDILFLCKDGKYVYFQFPNAPLLVAILAYVLKLAIPAQPYNNLLNIVFNIAIIIWAVLEIFWGVNNFRRIFGATILGFILFGLILR